MFQWSDILIMNNPLLANIHALSNLKWINGELYVVGNPSLQNLVGLEDLTHVTGLHVDDNDNLVDLSGLYSLQEIGRSVTITNNLNLINLHGLESITDPYSLSMVVADNPAMTSLEGMENMMLGLFDLNSFTFRNCAELSTCHLPNICALIASGATGMLTIIDNKSGCNSIAEVQNACVTATSGIHLDEVIIYPNPVRDYLIVEYDRVTATTYLIQDPLESKGEWQTFDGNPIDVTLLIPGFYLLILKTGDNILVLRFVKA
jgi:hypothetical protein